MKNIDIIPKNNKQKWDINTCRYFDLEIGCEREVCICENTYIEDLEQESLEEVADKVLQDEINYWYEKTGSLTSEDIIRRAYSLGVAWQAKRMFSEEEVLEIISDCDGSIRQAKKWFEQYKKK